MLGSGYVASAYMRSLHFLGMNPMIASRAWLDYHDPQLLRAYIRLYQPQLVINCAGYTGRTVDDCEVNKQECYIANVTLPRNLARVCGESGTRLVHISSGCIFTGPGPFKESDSPNNLDQFYAQCKAAAEQEILSVTKETGLKSWIFRIRMPFNHIICPRNWLVKIAEYPLILEGQNSITFLDEFTTRSYMLVQKDNPGVYHAAYPTPVSTLKVAELLLSSGLRRFPVLPYPPAEFYRCHCPRSQAVLDSSKFEREAGAAFGDPWAAIRWSLQNFRVASRAASLDGKAS